MTQRNKEHEYLTLLAIVSLGVAAVAGALFVSHWIAGEVLQRDALAISRHWVAHIHDHLDRRQSIAEGLDGGDGSRVIQELFGSDSLAAPALHAGSVASGSDELGASSSPLGLASAVALPQPQDDADHDGDHQPAAGNGAVRFNEVKSFHSGQHVSTIYRYALLDAQGRVLTKSVQFSAAEIADLQQLSSFRSAFESVIKTGKHHVGYAAEVAENAPAHIARVMVPIMHSAQIEGVAIVDTDQAAAITLIDGALNLVMLVSVGLIVISMTIPGFIAWRRSREHFAARRDVEFLALHDRLTSLPNRFAFINTLDAALKKARSTYTHAAVFCLDIDRFTEINDSLGHAAGDELLKSVGQRLREQMSTNMLGLSRLGNDEFAFIVQGADLDGRMRAAATRISKGVSGIHQVHGHEISVSLSIGIAQRYDDDATAEEMLRNATLALQYRKDTGPGRIRFYEPTMAEALFERRKLSRELDLAIEKGQMRIVYQPQFDLNGGRLSGYEALLRWEHPVKGTIAPTTFIPIAEETGAIHAIGEWILNTACDYATTWTDDVTVAVNLSPVQFTNPDLIDLIFMALERSGLPPHRLELEITESLLMHHSSDLVTMLQKLRDRGVGIAMDDFGTGYSSLSYLTRFPFTKIKIDRAFTSTLCSSRETSAIVATIVGLGRALGLTITAEGVETPEQAQLLLAAGCQQVQGYLYGKPCPQVLSSRATSETHLTPQLRVSGAA